MIFSIINLALLMLISGVILYQYYLIDVTNKEVQNVAEDTQAKLYKQNMSVNTRLSKNVAVIKDLESKIPAEEALTKNITAAVLDQENANFKGAVTTPKINILDKFAFTGSGEDSYLHLEGTGLVADSFTSKKHASLNGETVVSGSLNIQGAGAVQLGTGVKKEVNAGKIGYKTFSDGLDIVGAGETSGARRVTVWNEGGATFKGPIATPVGVKVTNGDPGPLIEKVYGAPGNRYGIGQYQGGKMRMYTGKAYAPATVNLSIAKDDGNFDDVLTIKTDKTTDISGNTNVNGTLKADKVQLGNKFLLSGVGDAHANDSWLRVLGKDGKDYFGGVATGMLWTRDRSWLNGVTNVTGNVAMNDGQVRLRAENDANHGIAYKNNVGVEKGVDGPSVFGCKGGTLGTVCGGEKAVLKWDSAGNVKINGSLTVCDVNGGNCKKIQ